MKTLKLIAYSAVALVLLISFNLAFQIAKANAPFATAEQNLQTTPLPSQQTFVSPLSMTTSIDGVLVSNPALDKRLALMQQAAD